MISFETAMLMENEDFKKIVAIIENSDISEESLVFALQEFNYSTRDIKQMANQILNSSSTRNYAAGGAVAGSLFGPIGALIGATGGAIHGGMKAAVSAKADLVRDKISSVRPSFRAKDILKDGDETDISKIVIGIQRHDDLADINIEDFLQYVSMYQDHELSKEDALHLEQIVTLVLQNKIQHLGKLL